MKKELTIIYNGSCPICSREVDHYRKRAKDTGAPVDFNDLSEDKSDLHGLDRDAAARRLHVLKDGQLVSGLDAFILLWEALPGFGRLARIAGHPLLRPLVAFGYDRIAASGLYALHRFRQRRLSRTT